MVHVERHVRGDTEQWIFPRVQLEEWEVRELVGTVVEILTTTLFQHHYYTFGGLKYHQMGGGPIGLRATCAVARVVMQLFDIKWKEILQEARISTEMLARYMDDARALLHPFKCGWRYDTRGLVFCQKWVVEDQNLTPTERTKRVLAMTMQGIEHFLEFTYETCEDDGFDGWLPTLDTCLRVGEENLVEYKYYEKPTCSKRTVQQKTAMNENSKLQIVSNDLNRRLKNTMEELGAPSKVAVVEQYALKLFRSGYSREQTRKILRNGIKGYERKRRSKLARGLPFRSTGKMSSGSRYRKKLLEKTNWYRQRKNKEEYKCKEQNKNHNKMASMKRSREQKHRSKKEPQQGSQYTKEPGREQLKKSTQEGSSSTPKTVLFVEYTHGGELANKMRELTSRLAPILGFKIKVVERAGTPLKSNFPLNNLWEGIMCGRDECVPCTQGAEELPQCTQPSLVYENVCKLCNPGAAEKREQPTFRTDIPTVYVGETSRSLFERTKEHWGAWHAKKEDSHILRHQVGAHGADEEPSFVMRAVKYHRTALYRQLGEAVRIRRRGGQGSILNSKAEYDRCYIPRLIVEEKDTREQELMEEQESLKSKEQQEEEEEQWSNVKLMSRNHQDRIESSKIGASKKSSSKKREQEQGKIPRSKKLKHEVLGEQWGWEQPTPIQEEQELPREPTVPEEQQALVEPMLPSLEPPPSPKEQRPNRRSRQSKLTTFLVQRPPEPAAEMNDSGGSEVGTQ